LSTVAGIPTRQHRRLTGYAGTLAARLVLLILVPALVYAALDPRFAGWRVVPHGLLYGAGVPYAPVLWFEQHFGTFAHFTAAFVLLLLLPRARIWPCASSGAHRRYSFLILLLLAPVLELVHWFIGRGFDAGDMLSHYCGMLAATAVWILIPVPDLNRVPAPAGAPQPCASNPPPAGPRNPGRNPRR